MLWVVLPLAVIGLVWRYWQVAALIAAVLLVVAVVAGWGRVMGAGTTR